MRIEARYELASEISTEYWAVDRARRGVLLDHFCAVTGYNRKYAMGLLRGRTRKRGKRRRRPLYGREVQLALRVLWEAAGYICAERLQPYLPALASTLERHLLRPYNNGFQPVMKLVEKIHRNDCVVKRDDTQTPLQRVIETHAGLPGLVDFEALIFQTNPLTLKRTIDRRLAAMPPLEVTRSA